MYIGWLYHPIYITELPMSTHITVDGKYTSATIFTDEVEASAMAQIYEMTNNPAFNAKIAIMPDVHAGKGSVIGFTMPYNGRVIPSVVGVDIGCGVSSVFVTMDTKPSITTDDLKIIDKAIRSVVPVGFNKYHKSVDVDKLFEKFKTQRKALSNVVENKDIINKVDPKYILDLITTTSGQSGLYGCGSLGGGNHFIEIGRINDTNNYLIMVHSGSRHFGLKVCEKWDTYMADNKLDYLEGRSAEGYLVDMCIAQQYAVMNRALILDNIMSAIPEYLGHIFSRDETVHNYISFDNEHVVIRKGAVSAHNGEQLHIPMNMADGVLCCIGKGLEEWNYSAPHGAGRLYSRSQAKKILSLDEFTDKMSDVYVSNLGANLLDESPMAYKDMNSIIDKLESCTLNYRTKPILNIKG